MTHIDVHSHCFPEMDDGPSTTEESLRMLQCAVDSGIKILYVTPHKEPNGKYNPDKKDVLQALKTLRKLASDHQLKIDCRYGEEFRVKTDSIDMILKDKVLGYQDTDYVLIEFTRTNVFSKLAAETIDLLKQRGKMILIAHPERYFDDLNDGVKTCKVWIQQGCFLQINRTSLTGFHGKEAEKLANRLITLGLAHVVGSDAHEGTGHRECRLDDVYHLVVKKHSKAQADVLFFDNPQNLVDNLPMIACEKPKLFASLKSRLKRPNHPEKSSGS